MKPNLLALQTVGDADISSLETVPKLKAINDLGGLLSESLITLIFTVIGLIFFINVVTAGWEYMMSSGDPKKISAASTRLTNNFLGLIITVTAFILVNLLTNFIGLDKIF